MDRHALLATNFSTIPESELKLHHPDCNSSLRNLESTQIFTQLAVKWILDALGRHI